MAIVDMLMPKMGESVMEGTILNWLKKVGDKIAQDESVLEVATDKVDTEVPAVNAGILVEMLAKVGDVVQVGKPVARIQTDASVAAEVPAAAPQAPTAAAPLIATPPATVAETGTNSGFYSPLVLNIAKEEKISMQELEAIKGSGREGRLTKNDLLAYVEKRKTAPVTQTATSAPAAAVAAPVVAPAQESKTEQLKPAVSFSGNFEIVEMDRMRKMIAQRMVDSKRISPHVTSFVEADVTNIVNWRNKWKTEFKKRGINLTFTPIFIEAVAKALQEFPMINASVDGDSRIILKKDINVGMAVALPSGNLIVPVIKNADHLNLMGLAQKVNDFAVRARENKLKTDDLDGGTYTLSNIGTFGNMLGTPIIMQPQVAILSTGAIIKKPAVISMGGSDMIGIRQMMFLSHSYDHRIVDGALGGMFVRKVADHLEKFDITRGI